VKITILVFCVLCLQLGESTSSSTFLMSDKMYVVHCEVLGKCNNPKVQSESYSTSDTLMSAKTVFLAQFELTCGGGEDKVCVA